MSEQKQPTFSPNTGKESHACVEVAFTVDGVEQFCQNLPTHDVMETTKGLYTFLACLNHQSHLDVIIRYQLSLLITKRIDYVFDVILKQYFSTFSQELTIQQHNIPILVENLFSLSKENYQVVIRSQLNKFFAKKDMLANCIAQCLRMNLKLLFVHFLTYKKPPKYLWIECHNLYQIAQKKNVLNKSISEIDQEIAHHTVIDWYKHLLLFSISNPYRLRSQETTLLYHAIAFWTKYVEIESSEHLQDELFSLDLSKDNPPVYSSLALFPTSRNTRVLGLKKLTTYLDGFLNEKALGSASERNLPSNLIKQLISIWSYFSNRGQDRITLHQPAKVFVGLHGVIQALGSEPSSTPSSSVAADCIIVNESPGGFCLEFDTHKLKIKPPQTGDLLGLSTQVENSKNQLTVGIIRWVKQLDKTIIQCGLQLIGHRPLAISIQIVSENENTLVGEPQQILFIPEVSAFGRRESIVSPSMPFKPGMKIKLLTPNLENINLPSEQPLRLLDVVLSTSNFKQFFIQIP